MRTRGRSRYVALAIVGAMALTLLGGPGLVDSGDVEARRHRPQVDLSVELSGHPEPIVAGHSAVLTATITNHSSIPVSGARLVYFINMREVVDPEAKYTFNGCAGAEGGFDLTGSSSEIDGNMQLRCALGELEPGESYEVRAHVLPDHAGDMKLRAKVKPRGHETNRRDNRDRLIVPVIDPPFPPDPPGDPTGGF